MQNVFSLGFISAYLLSHEMLIYLVVAISYFLISLLVYGLAVWILIVTW